jgi:hypothetical protein
MKTSNRDFVWPALDDRAGPARPLGDEDIRRTVRAAMAQPVSRPRRAVRLRRVLLLAAALLVVVASALALIGVPLRKRVLPATRPTRSQSGAPSPTAVAPAEPAAPPATGREPVPPEPTARAVAAPPRQPAFDGADADALLAHANALRGAKRWRLAASEYERVVQLLPDSAAAQAARVAAAELRLEQLGDPRRAERGFLEAQRRGGALAEEASWGLVRARRALGDGVGERLALQSFLEAYPAAAMAPQARARLAEMGLEP